jgi:PadR family transcriptional regulator, regulatory protein AphA
MDIKYAILGFLSWKPFTGYEIKKLIADSNIFYWSGNNNQIYTSLVQLHKEGMVTNQVQIQESLPSRKIYSITEQGLCMLKDWVLSPPEIAEFKKSFLVQLAWSNQLNKFELSEIIAKYKNEIEVQILMLKEKSKRRAFLNPSRSPRETYIWKMINENILRSYESELIWINELINNFPEGKE